VDNQAGTTTLKERLQADLAAAMRAGDLERRDTLRLLLAAVQQDEVDRRVALNDEGVAHVLSRQAKQRRESIADAQKASRPEMVVAEEAELDIIQSYLADYLPAMLSADEIRAEAQAMIQQVGASKPGDVGRVMAQLIPRLKDKADGRLVNQIVRELLLH
jgi:hypothetical protein